MRVNYHVASVRFCLWIVFVFYNIIKGVERHSSKVKTKKENQTKDKKCNAAESFLVFVDF